MACSSCIASRCTKCSSLPCVASHYDTGSHCQHISSQLHVFVSTSFSDILLLCAKHIKCNHAKKRCNEQVTKTLEMYLGRNG